MGQLGQIGRCILCPGCQGTGDGVEKPKRRQSFGRLTGSLSKTWPTHGESLRENMCMATFCWQEPRRAPFGWLSEETLLYPPLLVGVILHTYVDAPRGKRKRSSRCIFISGALMSIDEKLCISFHVLKSCT